MKLSLYLVESDRAPTPDELTAVVCCATDKSHARSIAKKADFFGRFKPTSCRVIGTPAPDLKAGDVLCTSERGGV